MHIVRRLVIFLLKQFAHFIFINIEVADFLPTTPQIKHNNCTGISGPRYSTLFSQ